MIVDTSVLVAIILSEPEHQAFATRILGEAPVRMSAGSLIELQTVINSRKIRQPLERITRLLSDLTIRIVPVDHEQARIAGEAYEQFGKGCGKISALNFGDCFAYALAKATGEPLMFKGDDFSKTDITRA